MATYGVGANLANYGMGQQAMASQELGQAAQDEQQRNIFNQQQRTANKAGNAQLGASLGALAGNAFLPGIGGVVGGVLGGIAGRIF